MPQQTRYHKDPEAVSRLNPEQHRGTQQDGTLFTNGTITDTYDK